MLDLKRVRKIAVSYSTRHQTKYKWNTTRRRERKCFTFWKIVEIHPFRWWPGTLMGKSDTSRIVQHYFCVSEGAAKVSVNEAFCERNKNNNTEIGRAKRNTRKRKGNTTNLISRMCCFHFSHRVESLRFRLCVLRTEEILPMLFISMKCHFGRL